MNKKELTKIMQDNGITIENTNIKGNYKLTNKRGLSYNHIRIMKGYLCEWTVFCDELCYMRTSINEILRYLK